MARVPITQQNVPVLSSNGFNLTDASFETMGTGTGNGVSFSFDAKDVVFLKNTTGGPAVFTVLVQAPTSITSIGGSVVDPTVTVADTKTHIIDITGISSQQPDGDVFIDCDVAADILVINK